MEDRSDGTDECRWFDRAARDTVRVDAKEDIRAKARSYAETDVQKASLHPVRTLPPPAICRKYCGGAANLCGRWTGRAD